MSTPTPYIAPPGTAVYQWCDIPIGWEYRYSTDALWCVKRFGGDGTELFVARPPQPERLHTDLSGAELTATTHVGGLAYLSIRDERVTVPASVVDAIRAALAADADGLAGR